MELIKQQSKAANDANDNNVDESTTTNAKENDKE